MGISIHVFMTFKGYLILPILRNQINLYHETSFSYTFSLSFKKRNYYVAFYTNWNQSIFLFYKKFI